MDARRFNEVLDEQLERVNAILGAKAGEYANDKDRLHNFKASASLQNISPMEALRGKMAKHTISIYDMMGSGVAFSVEQWDEKITDHINYLILLRALVIEEDEEDAKLGTGGTS
jgi:hypothetical protein